jgi:hypothetical protein
VSITSATGIRPTNLRLGYLLNFGQARFRTGIKRLINGKKKSSVATVPSVRASFFARRNAEIVG